MLPLQVADCGLRAVCVDQQHDTALPPARLPDPGGNLASPFSRCALISRAMPHATIMWSPTPPYPTLPARLTPQVRALAKREAMVLQSLSHVNVVRLLDAFKSKTGRVYLVGLASSGWPVRATLHCESRPPSRPVPPHDGMAYTMFTSKRDACTVVALGLRSPPLNSVF